MSKPISRLLRQTRPSPLRCLHTPHSRLRPLTSIRHATTTSASTSEAQDAATYGLRRPRRWTNEDEEDFMERLREFEENGPRNPLDTVTLHRLDAQRRAYYNRRAYYLGAGGLLSLLAPLLIIWNSDLEELQRTGEEKKKAREAARVAAQSGWVEPDRTDAGDRDVSHFRGKPVVVAPGGEKLVAKDTRSGHEDLEVVETGSAAVPHFPKTITIPGAHANEEEQEYTLLGLGIRTVSFLSIKVYVVGIYVQTSSLATLQASLIKQVNPIASTLIAGEKDKLKDMLLSPEESYAVWDKLLREKGVNTAIRIVPTRDTDFGHLRDGFVRGITQRTQGPAAARFSADSSKEYSDATFGASLKEFQSIFGGRGKAHKGSILLLTRSADGALGVMWSRREGDRFLDLGRVEDERMARQLMLLYLGGKTVSSEEARKSVVEGVVGLVERPVGTIETKVE